MKFPLTYFLCGFYSSVELFVNVRSGIVSYAQITHCNTFYLSMPRCFFSSYILVKEERWA